MQRYGVYFMLYFLGGVIYPSYAEKNAVDQGKQASPNVSEQKAVLYQLTQEIQYLLQLVDKADTLSQGVSPVLRYDLLKQDLNLMTQEIERHLNKPQREPQLDNIFHSTY